MDAAGFKATLEGERPPVGLSAPLCALWWDAKGDWSRAHEVAAGNEAGRADAWVHADLHRKEGDAGNARYWYSRAGQPVSRAPLDDERDAMIATLLTAGDRAA